MVHDASNGVEVNHRIRLLDQVRYPGAGEIRYLIRERREAGRKTFTILGDASKAHRRIKVQEKDWGMQACRLQEGRLWVNRVGTYGVSSAGYWWSRLAAVLLRLFYYLIGRRWDPEALLFADDLKLLASRRSEILDLAGIIAIFVACGVPFKWSKCRGGLRGHVDRVRDQLVAAPAWHLCPPSPVGD